MEKLWSFLRQKRNREVLGWVGGGLVVVAAGLWAVIVYVFPPSSSPSKSSEGAATSANCGGVAVGGNVSGSTVTAGNATGSDCSQKPK
jgi:hypothetical protein